MRSWSPREHQRGALWRTLEESPRYMEVLGRVAVDERMLLCKLEPEAQHVWLEPIGGRVYVQGRWTCSAECVKESGGVEDLPERREFGPGPRGL